MIFSLEGGGGQADQNVLVGAVAGLAVIDPGIQGHPVGAAAQPHLPQGAQLGQGAAGTQRPPILPHEPLLQPLGLHVDQLHLVRPVKHVVGNPLLNGGFQDGDHRVLDALDMLDIQGGVNVHPRLQKLLDVLVALFVAGVFGVFVGELVDQHQLGPPRQAGVQVSVVVRLPIGLVGAAEHPLKALCQGLGVGPLLPGAQADDHVHPGVLGLLGRLQHGPAFSRAGKIAGKNGQLSLFLALLFQLFLGSHVSLFLYLQEHRCPDLRFRE